MHKLNFLDQIINNDFFLKKNSENRKKVYLNSKNKQNKKPMIFKSEFTLQKESCELVNFAWKK